MHGWPAATASRAASGQGRQQHAPGLFVQRGLLAITPCGLQVHGACSLRRHRVRSSGLSSVTIAVYNFCSYPPFPYSSCRVYGRLVHPDFTAGETDKYQSEGTLHLGTQPRSRVWDAVPFPLTPRPTLALLHTTPLHS